MFCLRLSTFASVCLRLLAFLPLRLLAFVCVRLRLLTFSYAPLCCVPLCVTLIFANRDSGHKKLRISGMRRFARIECTL